MQAQQNPTKDFSALDDLIRDAIQRKVFPCASFLVANSKEVLYTKQFGNFTYEADSHPLKEDSMFDVASVTKVIATLSAIMRIYEEKKIDIMDPVVKYIPEFNNNGKDDILILNLLLHNSGLKPFCPFHQHGKTTPEQILEDIFGGAKEYETGTKTVYSCFGFITLCEIFKRVTGKTLDTFCAEEIFKPLGMKNSMLIPPETIRDEIVPTEVDNEWRKRLVQGTVHDETADILGGAAGNAGLFSTARDLVKYMQMMLNKGTYIDEKGEKQRLFQEETINLFTKCYEGLPYDNSRALGWDTKPTPPVPTRGPPCGDKFSKNSFGHTGFTGTCVWADKEKDLIVILLTNRVYPSRDLSHEGILNLRPVVHDKVCEILGFN